MATKTVNYELTLPEDNEPADQNVFNENFEEIDSILYDKVDKEEGKGLSTNDYTTAEKTKLDILAEIKTIGTGLNLDDNGKLTATGGGSGGTDDYEDLINQPQVNGNTLLGNKTSAQLGLASASDIPTTLAELTDDNTHRTVTDTEKAAWNAKADVADIPTVPIKGIEKNNTAITPDASGVVNITVPTTAADVSALPDTTLYGSSLSLSINTTTFVVTATLKDQNGNTLGTAQTIDLPLESVVVNGSYNSATKKVILTLQNGNTIEFSVADLVAGLQTELSASNKLNPAFINYDSTHRAVSDTEKSAWNNKSDFSGDYEDLNNLPTIPEALSDLSEDSTHRTVSDAEKSAWNAKASTATATTSAAGLMSSDDKTKLNNIASGAEVNVQSDWNVTSTTSDAYIKNKPTIPTASSASPKMDGTASSGSSSYWSRADHVHPTDTSRQAAASTKYTMASIGTSYTLVEALTQTISPGQVCRFTAMSMYNGSAPAGVIISRSNDASLFDNQGQLIAKNEETGHVALAASGLWGNYSSSSQNIYVWIKNAGTGTNRMFSIKETLGTF